MMQPTKNNYWRVLMPSIAAAGLALIAIILFPEDVATTMEGLKLLPVNFYFEPVVFVIALIPSFAQIYLSFEVWTNISGKKPWMTWSFWGLAGAIAFDVATDMRYRVIWPSEDPTLTQWQYVQSFIVALALNLFVFTLFSEIAITSCIVFLQRVAPELKLIFKDIVKFLGSAAESGMGNTPKSRSTPFSSPNQPFMPPMPFGPTDEDTPERDYAALAARRHQSGQPPRGKK